PVAPPPSRRGWRPRSTPSSPRTARWPGPRRSRGPWAYGLLPRGREIPSFLLARSFHPTAVQPPYNAPTEQRASEDRADEGWAFHSFELRHADQNQHNPKTSRVIPA